MGYYVTVLPALRVKWEYIDAVKRLAEEEKLKSEDQDELLSDMELSDSGEIEYAESSRKWYFNGRDFARRIAPFAEQGTLEFTGEDGKRWGFEFDGKGNAYWIEYHTKRGEKL